jgi:hypothetical protein
VGSNPTLSAPERRGWAHRLGRTVRTSGFGYCFSTGEGATQESSVATQESSVADGLLQLVRRRRRDVILETAPFRARSTLIDVGSTPADRQPDVQARPEVAAPVAWS